MSGATQGERITALEVKVQSLYSLVEEHNIQTKAMSEKLDQLLNLKNKGVGAFWLASTLVGTGVIGVLASALGWFKELFHG